MSINSVTECRESVAQDCSSESGCSEYWKSNGQIGAQNIGKEIGIGSSCLGTYVRQGEGMAAYLQTQFVDSQKEEAGIPTPKQKILI
ncbi:hypothetical protein Tco_1029736 [Tanacetum coccineum]|uniref:Uncharacterized protein n=1 Tax=Tanacetum coccineum TaxID=301880 RepID=A0ABQ5G4L3_9ASTR